MSMSKCRKDLGITPIILFALLTRLEFGLLLQLCIFWSSTVYKQHHIDIDIYIIFGGC